MMSTWAIVPVKSLADAKQRLASVLPLQARRKLMVVMLEDVLAAVSKAAALGPVLVVTPDPLVCEIALSWGARILREDRITGHSAAARAGFVDARAAGATRALALPADVPLVTPDELGALLESPAPRLQAEARGQGQHHSAPPPAGSCVTLVPSRDGNGTNAILVSPPDAFTPSFGPGSFARHVAHAAQHAMTCRILNLPGLALDIDEPRDLRELAHHTRNNSRYAFLHDYGLLPAGADQR